MRKEYNNPDTEFRNWIRNKPEIPDEDTEKRKKILEETEGYKDAKRITTL